MIYTVTLNPSIDYVISLNDLKKNSVNIVNTNNVYVGGKGINVSRILSEHGLESTTLGFISGFTGEFIQNILSTQYIKTDFINVKNNFSRINIKMKVQDEETEINGLGPKISVKDIEELFKKIDKISSGDVLVLAGSIPSDLNDDFYEKIMERLKNKNIKIIVDARNNLLLKVLKHNPFLIKPNHHEISEIFNLTNTDIPTLIDCGKKLQDMGAKNVIIKGGHFTNEESVDTLYDGENTYEIASIRVATKNTHGTGCTYSSAITSYLALGFSLLDAVKYAKQYITSAIIYGAELSLGKGSGPVNHFFESTKNNNDGTISFGSCTCG